MLHFLVSKLSGWGCFSPNCMQSEQQLAAVSKSDRPEELREKTGSPETQEMTVADTVLPEFVSMSLLNASPIVLQDCSENNPFLIDSAASSVGIDDIGFIYEKNAIDELRFLMDVPLNLNSKHLTVETLGEVLSLDCPNIIHISAHGLYNSQGEYSFALENEQAPHADIFSMTRLSKMLNAYKHQEKDDLPKLVFLASCHSEIAGQLFTAAGCQHVIVCKNDQRIMDLACRYFFKFFYRALFSGHSIHRSFEIARVNVDVAFDSTSTRRSASQAEGKNNSALPESHKFLLLPEDADHDVVLFPHCPLSVSNTPSSQRGLMLPEEQPEEGCNSNSKKRKSRLERKSGSGSGSGSGSFLFSPLKDNIPPLTEHVVGRQTEIQTTIGLLSKHRCVNIFGPRKFGKTTVAKSALHWLQERRKYRHGIYWIDMTTINSRDDFAQTLIERVIGKLDSTAADSGSDFSDTEFDVLEVFDAPGSSGAEVEVCDSSASRSSAATKDLLTSVLSQLVHMECLICLDNCGSSIGAHVALELLQQTHMARLLVTSVAFLQLPAESGFSTQFVFVRELSMNACLELIYRLSPWMIMHDNTEHQKLKQCMDIVVKNHHSPFQIRQVLMKMIA